MGHCRAAERALVAAVALGEVDPAELVGRLYPSDFTDPAAAACLAVMMDRSSPLGVPRGANLPELLRVRGMLRGDGYPLRELLDWLPSVPVPVHPQAWATLVIAGVLGRVVQASGLRILQAADSADPAEPASGRVLAVVAAQRAALHGALSRWDRLPAAWRDSVPTTAALHTAPSAVTVEAGHNVESDVAVEREVLAGVVAAPHLVDRMGWLRASDFSGAAHGEVYRAVRGLHADGRPVDLVTLAATIPLGTNGRGGTDPTAVYAALRPDRAFVATVPLLARRVLDAAAVREASRAGQDLLDWVAAPAQVGGLGRELLTASLTRLDALRPYAERVERAHRPVLPREVGRDRQDVRSPSRAALTVPDRTAS